MTTDEDLDFEPLFISKDRHQEGQDLVSVFVLLEVMVPDLQKAHKIFITKAKQTNKQTRHNKQNKTNKQKQTNKQTNLEEYVVAGWALEEYLEVLSRDTQGTLLNNSK